MRTRTIVSLALGMGLAVVGCAPPASGPEWTGTLEERDGVTRATNPDEPLWPTAERPRLRLELEQTFGADEEPAEAMLVQVRGVAADLDGNVYAIDQGDSQIVAFDRTGDLLWRAGREGEGPGEIQRPRGIAWDGADRLYVLNQSGTQVDAWSIDGEHVGTRLLAGTSIPSATGIGFVEDGLLGLYTGGHEPEVHLLAAGGDWDTVRSFTVDAGGGSVGGASIRGDLRLQRGLVTAGDVNRFEMRIYDAAGALQRVIARPGTDFLPAVIDLERRAVGSMGNASAPLAIEGGYWLAEASWPTNVDDPEGWLQQVMAGERSPREYRRVLDLYDAEGRWLTGRVWDHPDAPEHGYILGAGPDGALYTVRSDPFPQIRRYRLVIEPPSDG